MGTVRALTKSGVFFGLLGALIFIGSFRYSVAAQDVGAPDQAQLRHYFDQSLEFPNYFLPAEYRALPRASVPADQLAKARDRLERAMGSVFDRLIIPIVPVGASKPEMVRYFPYMEKNLKKIDPQMKLYASGGVVRSALSYVYDQVYRAMERNPGAKASDVLESISRATEDLPAIRVRGVGSDFDLLIHSDSGKFDELRKRALEITNSASQRYANSTGHGSIANTFFTMGDIRDYDEQIERSTRQGGSTVDYLGYETSDKKLKAPQRFPNSVEDLVLGYFDFAMPATGALPEDRADTAIRGVRSLIEVPWLKLSHENYFRSQIKELHYALNRGELPSARAQGQFAKGIRNSRHFGAHNRFYRAKDGSLESDVLSYSKDLGQKTNHLFLPEFADDRDIALRSASHSELHGLPLELLTPPDQFILENTRHGLLYHGTPSIDNGLAILRLGLCLSKSGQGTAAFCRGVYSSPDRSFAQTYAGTKGVVFELKIKNDSRVNILDLDRHQTHPAIEAIRKQALAQNRDFFEVLSRDHGIDIIKKNYVLIQNSNAVEVPAGLQSVLAHVANRWRGVDKMSEQDLVEYMGYQGMLEYGDAVGEVVPVSMHERERINRMFVKGSLIHSDRTVRDAGFRLLEHFPRNEQIAFLEEATRSTHEAWRLLPLIEALAKIAPTHSRLDELMVKLLNQEKHPMDDEVLKVLYRLPPEDQSRLLEKAISEFIQSDHHVQIPLYVFDCIRTGKHVTPQISSLLRRMLSTHVEKWESSDLNGIVGTFIELVAPGDQYEFLISALESGDLHKQIGVLKQLNWSKVDDPRIDQVLVKMVLNQELNKRAKRSDYYSERLALNDMLELRPPQIKNALVEQVIREILDHWNADTIPEAFIETFVTSAKVLPANGADLIKKIMLSGSEGMKFLALEATPKLPKRDWKEILTIACYDKSSLVRFDAIDLPLEISDSHDPRIDALVHFKAKKDEYLDKRVEAVLRRIEEDPAINPSVKAEIAERVFPSKMSPSAGGCLLQNISSVLQKE